MACKSRPVVRGITQGVVARQFAAYAPPLEIIDRARSLAQTFLIENPCLVQSCIKRPQVVASIGIAAFLRNLKPKPVRQLFYGSGKIEPFILKQESKGRSVRAAAEAMIELLVRANSEGRGFFLMERATGDVFLTPQFQRHIRLNQRDDVRPGKQLVYKPLRYAPAH